MNFLSHKGERHVCLKYFLRFDELLNFSLSTGVKFFVSTVKQVYRMKLSGTPLSYEWVWKRGSRKEGWDTETNILRDLDTDSHVFIQLSNLFNVCIHFAMPPSTL